MTTDQEDPKWANVSGLQEALRSFNEPPGMPREALWTRIDHARRRHGLRRIPRAAAAAVIAFAIFTLGAATGYQAGRQSDGNGSSVQNEAEGATAPTTNTNRIIWL